MARSAGVRSGEAILFCVLSCTKPAIDPCAEAKQEGYRCISVASYRDKMRAAWLGQMVGVAYGQPVEFLYRGRTIPEESAPAWSPFSISLAYYEDDLLVDISFLDALSKEGLDITKAQVEAHFASTKFPLWHANDAARERLRAGLSPSSQHAHSSDIDYQIEADFSGLISVGAPKQVIAFGDLFGGVICEGECIDGGKFMGCLYAEAFFTSDRKALIEEALRCIPEGKYASAVRDVLRWYQESPSDWRVTWQKIEERYDAPLCRGGGSGKEGDGFNINASLNGAYVIAGLLYGEGDIERTMKITAMMGQDADCNVSSALGVLFTLIGEERLPDVFRPKLPAWRFKDTEYTFARLIEVTEKLARDGAHIVKTSSGEVFLVKSD